MMKLNILQIAKRNVLAVLLLAIAFTNSHVAVAQAETVDTSANTQIVTDITPPTYTVQEVLLAVCQSNGYGEDCARTLLGMLWNESSNVYNVVGDHGLALGYFQIHYKMHKITADCATDLVCSANWTINYMEAHSYPKYVSYAVQCHNSCNVNNGYAARALRNGKRLWNQPLTITQDAPIELPQIQLAVK